MFVLQNAPMPPFKASDLSICLLDLHNNTAKYDILFSLIDDANQLKGYIEFNTSLLEVDSIEKIAQHFQILFN